MSFSIILLEISEVCWNS